MEPLLRRERLSKVRFPSLDENFIVPSVLSADFSNLQREIRKVERYSGWIHIDIMDGHFVKNLSFGPHITSCIRKITDLPLDVHLMVENPIDFIDPFVKSGADLITVHYESKDFLKAIKKIKKLGIKAGIAIKPKTPPDIIYPYIKMVDLILIMSVEPGFGGQEFIWDVVGKIKDIRDFITSRSLKKYIQVDGGINERTILYAMKAGANSFVMGSALFSRRNPFFVKKMYNLIRKG